MIAIEKQNKMTNDLQISKCENLERKKNLEP